MKSPDNIFFQLQELAFLDPTAIIGRTVRIRKPKHVRIGAGSIIDDFTYISCGMTIGNYSHIGASGVIIGGDAHVNIGHFVNIAPGVRLIAASNDFAGGGLVGPTIPQVYAGKSIIDRIELGDHVLTGTNVVILPGVIVPEGCAFGAATIVTTKVKLEPWTLYVGNPARPIRERDCKAIKASAENLINDRIHEFNA